MERVVSLFHHPGMYRFRHIALALSVVLFATSCGQKPDAKVAAQQFFDQVASGNAQQAHNEATFAFQAEQNARVFEQAAREQGLIGAKGVALEPLESDGKAAKYNAVISTATGAQRTYIVTLQQESGVWKVFSLKPPRNPETGLRDNHFGLVGKGTGGFSDPLNQPMPDDREIQRLVTETLKAFNDAVQQKSFADFYANVSLAWQGQLTERQLTRAFQPFVDQGVDLSGALKLQPVLDPAPQITTEGLLMVSGHYPSKPYQVEFALKFIYELPTWKLFGIDVNLRKAQE
jgi:hypothetical protein